MLEYISERIDAGMEVAPEDIEPEQLTATKTIIDLFWDISKFRTSNGMGPNGISLPDIDAYCRYSGLVLKWSEIEWLKTVDGQYLKHFKAPKSDG